MTPFTTRILEWMAGFYDAETGLLGYPSAVGSPTNPYQQRGVPIVRETTAFALGLLARDGPGDRETAARCLHRVLAHQIDRPGTVVHGTFRRSPVEPEPGDEPREWIDYDPNWREFIGTALAVTLESYEDRLPADLVGEIERSLRLAIDGTRARRVTADYTNIALMCAFLLDWVGDRLGEPRWRDEAVTLADAVRRDYLVTGAFPEHNSPTYYGVDLYGLALWRARARAPQLRSWGEELESALWRDLARFYHAGLQNLCGPFTRAYGMDMHRYVASLGVWIAAAGLEAPPPLPELGDAADHAHDFCQAPLVELLGSRPPEDVRRALVEFAGERRVEQLICKRPRRVASAWLAPGLMLGGEHTSGRYVHWQHHPATVHWRRPEGPTGWIRVVSNAPLDAVAERGRLTVTVHGGLRGLREASVEVGLEIDPALGERSVDPATGAWELPGLALRMQADPDVGPPRALGSDGPAAHGGACFGWRFEPGTAPSPLFLTLHVALPGDAEPAPTPTSP